MTGYHGIMATTPSYVTFSLKIALFIIVCMQYKYAFNMAPVYDVFKHTY